MRRRRRRLESWKEIASYLDRSSRTVRRWESGEGLPVHRHQHGKGSTVFAYSDELEAWRETRVAGATAGDEPEPPPAERIEPVQPRLHPRAAMATAMLALVVSLIALMRSGSIAPESPGPPGGDAEVAASGDGALEAAVRYAARVERRGTEGGEAVDPEDYAFAALLPARRAWLEGDIIASVHALDELAERFDTLERAAGDAVARAAGRHCLAMGRIECSRRWFARLSDPVERYELEGYRLFAAGRMDAFAAHLAAGGAYALPETAVLLAMVGETEKAERLASELAERGREGSQRVARGAFSLFGGDPAAAHEQLAAGVRGIESVGSGMHFIGLDMLSRIAEQGGDLGRAIELLEMTNEQRDRAILQGSGLFWIKCQARLADVYRGMGRVEDALRVERALLTALALSDPDHPTTTALRRRTA